MNCWCYNEIILNDLKCTDIIHIGCPNFKLYWMIVNLLNDNVKAESNYNFMILIKLKAKFSVKSFSLNLQDLLYWEYLVNGLENLQDLLYWQCLVNGLDGLSTDYHSPCNSVTKQVSMQQRMTKSRQVHTELYFKVSNLVSIYLRYTCRLIITCRSLYEMVLVCWSFCIEADIVSVCENWCVTIPT